MLPLALLLLALAAMCALLLSMSALAKTGVPVRAASPEAIEAALALLALQDGERFGDLGCGDGRVLRAARARRDVEAFGFELNPFALAWAALRSDRRTRLRWADFRRAELGPLDAAYAYLMPRAMRELDPVLRRQMRPGARLASVDFPIPGWTPLAVREVGPLRQPVFLYAIPTGAPGRSADP